MYMYGVRFALIIISGEWMGRWGRWNDSFLEVRLTHWNQLINTITSSRPPLILIILINFLISKQRVYLSNPPFRVIQQNVS